MKKNLEIGSETSTPLWNELGWPDVARVKLAGNSRITQKIAQHMIKNWSLFNDSMDAKHYCCDVIEYAKHYGMIPR